MKFIGICQGALTAFRVSACWKSFTALRLIRITPLFFVRWVLPLAPLKAALTAGAVVPFLGVAAVGLVWRSSAVVD